MRKLISISYLVFILFMGMVQGGYFIDKMECTGSGSIALALNTRIACCEGDSDNAEHTGITNPCCIHKSFFVENDINPEHQITKINIPVGIVDSTPANRTNVAASTLWPSSLEIRPPPLLTHASLCTFRI
jgi:hypothetical protein